MSGGGWSRGIFLDEENLVLSQQLLMWLIYLLGGESQFTSRAHGKKFCLFPVFDYKMQAWDFLMSSKWQRIFGTSLI